MKMPDPNCDCPYCRARKSKGDVAFVVTDGDGEIAIFMKDGTRHVDMRKVRQVAKEGYSKAANPMVVGISLLILEAAGEVASNAKAPLPTHSGGGELH